MSESNPLVPPTSAGDDVINTADIISDVTSSSGVMSSLGVTPSSGVVTTAAGRPLFEEGKDEGGRQAG